MLPTLQSTSTARALTVAAVALENCVRIRRLPAGHLFVKEYGLLMSCLHADFGGLTSNHFAGASMDEANRWSEYCRAWRDRFEQSIG